ncbi:MAG: TerC family protein [Alphaproteobacteria bacterium]
MDSTMWLWGGFGAVIVTLLALDLGILHRKARAVTMREALTWSVIWVGCAILFNIAIFFWRGPQPALEFMTGYLIELALSVDNLFVFMILFGQFGVPPALQHRVLFWGVLGAIAMRAVMIVAGAALITNFHWILYLFGVFLAITGFKMLFAKDEEATSPADQPFLRWVRNHLPVTNEHHGDAFVVRVNGRSMVTPLFIVLISVEFADLMFATDSVPAIFAVTTDPFVVFTSNIFAILGLRSFYFALRDLMARLKYLKYGLSLVLMFIGVKILLAGVYPLPVAVALGVTFGILAVTVTASLLATRRSEA